MKAVARLIATFFFGTRASMWLTLSGLLLQLASVWVVMNWSQTEHMLTFAWSGVIVMFLGSSTMPLMVGRLAQGRAASIMPGARIKLLISAILTVLLVALPVGILTPLAYVAGMSAEVSRLGEYPQLMVYTQYLAILTYTSCCLIAGWLYIFIWFISSQRDVYGVGKGIGVVLFALVLPSRAIRELPPSIASNLVQMAGFVLVFGAGFLAWPRIKVWLARWKLARPSGGSSRKLAGKEIDLMLGNARPWPLIIALLLPLALATRLTSFTPAVWLFYLTIASTTAGAFAGQIPARSRALWLRGDWSRASMFSAVEKSSWRHNGFVLGALLLFLVGIGSYGDMPAPVMAVGIPLLVLGTVLSTYLGLLLTRGVRFPEAVVGIVVMLTLMTLSLWLGEDQIDYGTVIGTLVALAVLAVALRQLASRRWARIDWSECRVERLSESRSSA
jgi:hypothetical protein